MSFQQSGRTTLRAANEKNGCNAPVAGIGIVKLYLKSTAIKNKAPTQISSEK